MDSHGNREKAGAGCTFALRENWPKAVTAFGINISIPGMEPTGMAPDMTKAGPSGLTQSHPAVSVVVPCFNGGRFLDALMASLARQTFRDFRNHHRRRRIDRRGNAAQACRAPRSRARHPPGKSWPVCGAQYRRPCRARRLSVHARLRRHRRAKFSCRDRAAAVHGARRHRHGRHTFAAGRRGNWRSHPLFQSVRSAVHQHTVRQG